jgi:hypothetical protein
VKSSLDLIKLGFALGIGVPILTFLIFYLWKADTMTLPEYVRFLADVQALPKLMSLAVIPNLGIFFLFLRKDHYYATRGVLAATIVLAILILILKYLI